MAIIEVPDHFNQAEFLTNRHLREARADKIAIYYRERAEEGIPNN
jgi:acyl-coenzyme A synthetase/AMP-(fatty) acid ligase